MRKYLIVVLLFIFAGNAGATDYGFGGDTTGATGAQCSDSSIWVDTCTTPANSGNLDSAVCWLDANYKGPHNVSVIIYNNDSTVLDSTLYFTVSTSARTRYKSDFKQGAAVSASTKYFIGFHLASAGGTNGALKIDCNTGITPQWRYISGSLPTIPATMTGTSTTAGYAFALWLFYSDGGAPPAPSTRRKLILQK